MQEHTRKKILHNHNPWSHFRNVITTLPLDIMLNTQWIAWLLTFCIGLYLICALITYPIRNPRRKCYCHPPRDFFCFALCCFPQEQSARQPWVHVLVNVSGFHYAGRHQTHATTYAQLNTSALQARHVNSLSVLLLQQAATAWILALSLALITLSLELMEQSVPTYAHWAMVLAEPITQIRTMLISVTPVMTASSIQRTPIVKDFFDASLRNPKQIPPVQLSTNSVPRLVATFQEAIPVDHHLSRLPRGTAVTCMKTLFMDHGQRNTKAVANGVVLEKYPCHSHKNAKHALATILTTALDRVDPNRTMICASAVCWIDRPSSSYP